MHSVYALVLIKPLHPPADLFFANEAPLYIRRRKLSIQYSLKLSSSPQNPTQCSVLNFDRKPNEFPSLGIRIQPDLRAVGFLKGNALKYSVPITPPWLLKRLHIDYSIHQCFKAGTSPEIYRNKFFEFCDLYKDFCQLYTDGSRMGDQELNYMLFHLHWLLFAVVKTRILLCCQTPCQAWKL